MAIRVFTDIWKSKVSRVILLLLLLLSTFAAIYLIRIDIYTSLSTIGRGMVFDDPSTYDEGPFGFTEDAEQAESLYRESLEQLLEYTEDPYNFTIVEPLFDDAISEKENWSINLSPENAKIIKIYLNDIRVFCQNFRTQKTINAEIDYTKQLNQRHKIISEENGQVSEFAISKGSFLEHANQLLSVDEKTLEMALQKKPDYLPALDLRNKIRGSVCKELTIPLNIMRTLGYLEYKFNKIEYFKGKHLHTPDPEIISENTFQSLKSNRTYKSLIKKHFSHSYYNSGNESWKAKKSWSLYILSQDKDYLNKHIASTLKISRVSNIQENKSYYNQLLSIKHRGIEFEFLYNYALAEVAFRAGSIERSKMHLNKISKNRSFNRHPDIVWAKRLKFALEVME